MAVVKLTRLHRIKQKRKAEEYKAKRRRGASIQQLKAVFNCGSSKAATNYLYHIARILDGLDEELEDLLTEWGMMDAKGAAAVASKKPMLFYYYLKEKRPSEAERTFIVCLEEVCSQHGIRTTADVTALRESGIITRLQEFIAGSGNDLTDTTLDYLEAAVTKIRSWKPELAGRINLVCGAMGWEAWEGYLNSRGGPGQYLKASEQQLQKAQALRQRLFAVAQLRAKLLQQGEVGHYDALGRLGDKVEKIQNYCDKHGLELGENQ